MKNKNNTNKDIDKDIKNLSAELNDEEINKFLDNIEKEIKSSLPLPTDEELNDKNKYKKYEKRLTEYKTKLKAGLLNQQIKKVLGLREERNKQEKYNLELINKEFMYKRGRIEKIREYITGTTFIDVGIVDKTGNIKYHKVQPKDTDTVIVQGGEYLLDIKGLLRKQGRPTFHYFKGNPHPIIYDHEGHSVIVTAESLNKIWNSKIVNQLFDVGSNTGRVVAWTVGGIMAVGLVIVMILAVAPESIKTAFGLG